MPMQRSLYPKDWTTIALEIKTDARWHCQNCDRPCRRPGETLQTLEARLQNHPEAYKTVESELGNVAVFCPGRFTLTVAHLDHQPANCHPSNLRAWCAPCHGRYDLNAIRSGAKARAALERAGQLSLLDLLLPSQ
jgi:hypothetical protein